MDAQPRFPFDLKVYIYTRPHLRDDSLEFELYLGRNVLEDIFDNLRERPDVERLNLSFPEMWLNIIEQRQLFERLQHYCKNLKEVVIKTHSVYIIQCTPKRHAFMVDEGDAVKTIGDCSPVTKRLYVPMKNTNYFDISKINVV